MKEHHGKVMTLFRQFDRNGDGQISVSEFQNGCQKLGIPASTDDIKVETPHLFFWNFIL